MSIETTPPTEGTPVEKISDDTIIATPPQVTVRPSRSILPGLLSLLAILLAAAAVSPWVVPQIGLRTPLARNFMTQQPAAPLVTPADLQALENRLSEKPMPVAAPQANDPQLATLQARLDNLNGTVAAQTQQLAAQAAAQQQLAGTVTTQSVQAALAALQPLLALQRISARLDAGAAYETDLAVIAAKLLDSEQAALAPLAQGGDSTGDLAEAVDSQKRQLVATYREATATTWWDKMRARLSSLIYIKTAGTDDDEDVMMATLDRLGTQIHRGDTAGALSAIDGLPDTVKGQLADIAGKLHQRAVAADAVSAAMVRLTNPPAVKAD